MFLARLVSLSSQARNGKWKTGRLLKLNIEIVYDMSASATKDQYCIVLVTRRLSQIQFFQNRWTPVAWTFHFKLADFDNDSCKLQKRKVNYLSQWLKFIHVLKEGVLIKRCEMMISQCLLLASFCQFTPKAHEKVQEKKWIFFF